MKICNKCQIEKPDLSFFKDKNNKKYGLYSLCKDCKKNAVYEWRSRNREKYNAGMRARNLKNKDLRRDIDLKRKYGSSLIEYNQILASQSGCCWICRKPNKSVKRSFAMDHDHKTGKRRGILCYGCNRALHTLEKDGLLQRAFAYLEMFK